MLLTKVLYYSSIFILNQSLDLLERIVYFRVNSTGLVKHSNLEILIPFLGKSDQAIERSFV
jgi:hypothetical protein